MGLQVNYSVNGKQGVVDVNRPLQGGTFHADLLSFIQQASNMIAPSFVVYPLAANGSFALNTGYNIFTTTGNTTIANAVFNLPNVSSSNAAGANGDGTVVVISTTGAVGNVTGTVANASYVIPPVTSMTLGIPVTLGYNAKANVWFRTT